MYDYVLTLDKEVKSLKSSQDSQVNNISTTFNNASTTIQNTISSNVNDVKGNESATLSQLKRELKKALASRNDMIKDIIQRMYYLNLRLHLVLKS